jgi:hypothetical protein
MFCKIPKLLANSMITYFIASVFYLVITFTCNFGTPFKDALKAYPELQKIQKESTDKRKQVFFIGFLFGFLIVLFMKPFQECYDYSNSCSTGCTL